MNVPTQSKAATMQWLAELEPGTHAVTLEGISFDKLREMAYELSWEMRLDFGPADTANLNKMHVTVVTPGDGWAGDALVIVLPHPPFEYVSEASDDERILIKARLHAMPDGSIQSFEIEPSNMRWLRNLCSRLGGMSVERVADNMVRVLKGNVERTKSFRERVMDAIAKATDGGTAIIECERDKGDYVRSIVSNYNGFNDKVRVRIIDGGFELSSGVDVPNIIKKRLGDHYITLLNLCSGKNVHPLHAVMLRTAIDDLLKETYTQLPNSSPDVFEEELD